MAALEVLYADLSHGLRLIRRSPAYAATVVLLLALGIGATTAVFSVVRKVLLTPLPYPSPDRVTMVWETEGERYSRVPVSQPNFLDWRQQAKTFQAMAPLAPRPFSLSGGEEPEQIMGASVTAEIFEVLGVAPARGRAFSPDEEELGGEPVAILSDSLWRRNFGAAEEVLGRDVLLEGTPHTVIGIMPPGFNIETPWTMGERLEIWTPHPLSAAIEDRDSHSMMVFARLAPGFTLETAQSEMHAISAALEAEYPETNHEHGARVAALREALVGRTRPQLLTLLGAAAFVLLIVCANAGGLLLAKTSSRQGELAVRASLGASRARLIGQVLVENVPLVALGGVAGALLASWGLWALGPVIPSTILGAREIAIDGPTLAFTAAVCLIAAVVLGLAPALAGSRTDVVAALHHGRKGETVRAGRSRRLLIVAQVALTLVLANGAALMLASYGKLQATDQGFDAAGTLTARLALNGSRYEDFGQVEAFQRAALARVRAMPGVEQAAITTKLPLEGGTNGTVVIEGREEAFGTEEGPLAERSLVTPGYFEAMQIRLLQGRLFSEFDMSGDATVAVVNQAMVREAWPDQDPIGRRFALDSDSGWITVVGVVADVRQWRPERPAIAEYYFPLAATPAYWWSEPKVWRSFVVLRANIRPTSLVRSLTAEIRAVDPLQPVADVRTMDQIQRSASSRRTFNTLLIAIFAAIAVVLVVTGIYGLMSTFVAHRTPEIGIRMALGANAGGVLRMVLGQGVRLLAIGIGVGTLAVLASTRLLASLLYGISPTEPTILITGTMTVALVALSGSLIPAFRAARIDPATALRQEN